jgi:hypothetical protein
MPGGTGWEAWEAWEGPGANDGGAKNPKCPSLVDHVLITSSLLLPPLLNVALPHLSPTPDHSSLLPLPLPLRPPPQPTASS